MATADGVAAVAAIDGAAKSGRTIAEVDLGRVVAERGIAAAKLGHRADETCPFYRTDRRIETDQAARRRRGGGGRREDRGCRRGRSRGRWNNRGGRKDGGGAGGADVRAALDPCQIAGLGGLDGGIVGLGGGLAGAGGAARGTSGRPRRGFGTARGVSGRVTAAAGRTAAAALVLVPGRLGVLDELIGGRCLQPGIALRIVGAFLWESGGAAQGRRRNARWPGPPLAGREEGRQRRWGGVGPGRLL